MKIEFNLPEWAFLDAHSHLGDELENRTVILHIRSVTLIELLDENQVNEINFNPGFLYFDFEYKNVFGIVEKLRLIIHYSATLNVHKDSEYIIESILKPCSLFYSKYADWEDEGIIDENISKLN